MHGHVFFKNKAVAPLCFNGPGNPPQCRGAIHRALARIIAIIGRITGDTIGLVFGRNKLRRYGVILSQRIVRQGNWPSIRSHIRQQSIPKYFFLTFALDIPELR